MSNPLISIITVCYNSQATIQKTFESILKQDINNFEYIIIDGKSTDSTIDLINQYLIKFQTKQINTKFISEKDNGIYYAMNKGIKLAQGEWVIFLNSDDWYEDNAILKLTKYIDNKFDVIVGSINAIKFIENNYYYKIINPSLKNLNKNMTLLHPSTLVKKSIIEKFYFDTSFKIAADWNLLKKLFNNNYKFLLINDVLVNYMEHGISSDVTLKLRFEQYRVINKTNPIYAKFNLTINIIRIIIKKLRLLIYKNKTNKKVLHNYQLFNHL